MDGRIELFSALFLLIVQYCTLYSSRGKWLHDGEKSCADEADQFGDNWDHQ